jgi:cell division protein ZapA
MGEEGKTRIKVKIAGREYTLQTSEDKEYILELVNYVDDKIKKQLENTPTNLDAIILAALNIADDYFKLRKEHDEIMSSLERYSRIIAEQTEGSLKSGKE